MKLTIPSLTRIFRYFLFLGLLVYAASATTVSNAQTQTVILMFYPASGSSAEASGFGDVLRVTTSNGAAVESAKTVTVNVTGGTATSEDYNRTGTITIPAGTVHNSLVSIASGITITDDSIREANETITLSLSSPSSGAALGPQIPTTHTITDDETAYLAQSDSGASFSEDIGVLAEDTNTEHHGNCGRDALDGHRGIP